MKNLPGYGYSGQLTSKTTNKRVARRMEEVLFDVANMAIIQPKYTRILDAVCRDKSISLPDLVKAHNAGELDQLLLRFHDPQLVKVINDFAAIDNEPATALGLEMLRPLIPEGVRFSWLCDAKRITLLCSRAERGEDLPEDQRKPRHRNSVDRCLKRAISKLIRHEMGEAERSRIFADVAYTRVDDTRRVHLTVAQIRDLLEACHALEYHELALIIRTALLTSADRGVLLAGPRGRGGDARGLLRRDLRVFEMPDGRLVGEVHLLDRKTQTRPRTVPLSPSLCQDLLIVAEPKSDDEPVFSLAYRDLDFVWKAVRRKAGLPGLRFKDLRAQITQYGEEAGVPLTVLQATMGHDDDAMTRRYQEREAVMSQDQISAIEAKMGLAAST